jgi:hypothetical protein
MPVIISLPFNFSALVASDCIQGMRKCKCGPGRRQIWSPLLRLKTDQISQKFVTINNVKFTDTVTKTVIGVVILETVLYTLLHIIFRLLPISCHDLNKSTVSVNFRFKKKNEKGLQNLPPQAAAWGFSPALSVY